jgi:hypothetical protein
MANAPEFERAEPLPETIGPVDLERLNEALAELFKKLRFARNLPRDRAAGREGAVGALTAVFTFLMRFEPVREEILHMPLLNLAGALLALDQNNVEPILKPTKRTGRAMLSSRQYALRGIAVGTALRLEWTGLSPTDANKAVATKLNALGVKPTRGKEGVTAATVRRWREQIDVVRPLLELRPQEFGSGDLGWITAATNADDMVTEEWRTKITTLTTADARRFVLSSLEANIREMILAFPAKSPS